MKFSRASYIAIFLVVLVSVLLIVFLPIGETAQIVIASPVAFALCGAIFQVIRDEASYRKEIELQRNEKIHFLSVSSHMAVRAFDKHAEFAEKYLKEIESIIEYLWDEGTSAEAIKLSRNLTKIRLDYAAWLSEDTSEQLRPFENALKKIGVNDSRAARMPSGHDKREELLDEAEKLWEQILEIEPKEISEIGHTGVLIKVRNLLGIEELTRLRSEAIHYAIQSR